MQTAERAAMRPTSARRPARARTRRAARSARARQPRRRHRAARCSVSVSGRRRAVNGRGDGTHLLSRRLDRRRHGGRRATHVVEEEEAADGRASRGAEGEGARACSQRHPAEVWFGRGRQSDRGAGLMVCWIGGYYYFSKGIVCFIRVSENGTNARAAADARRHCAAGTGEVCGTVEAPIATWRAPARWVLPAAPARGLSSACGKCAGSACDVFSERFDFGGGFRLRESSGASG